MKTRILKLCFLFLVSSTINAQSVFVALDDDFPYNVERTTVTSQGLVVFSSKAGIGYHQAEYRLSVWNGLFWTDLPTIAASNVFYGSNNNLVVKAIDNEIIIAGSFYADQGKIKGITRWTGIDWEPLSGGINTSRLIHDEFSILDVESFQDQIFVCGDFNLAGGKQVKNFAMYDKNVWVDIPTGAGLIKHLQTLDSTMYAAGEFTSIDGVVCNNIASLNNGKWAAVNNAFDSPILQVSTYGGNLVAVTKNGFFVHANDAWNILGSPIKTVSINNVLEFQGRLFASGLFIQNETDSLRLIALTNSEMTVYLRDREIQSKASKNIQIDEFNKTLYVSGSFSGLKGKKYNQIAGFKPGSSVIEGRVYMDNNNNCVYDDGDEVKPNAIVMLNKGESYSSTNARGFYSIFLRNQETSTIQIFPADEEVPLCNGAERTIVTSGSDSLLTEDFALKLDKMTPVKLSFTGETGFVVKHGYSTDYLLNCGSADQSKFPIEVSLNYDYRLSEFHSSIQPVSQTSGVVKWKIDKNTTIKIQFLVSPYAIEMGEELAFKVQSRTGAAEEYNSYELVQTVVSAFDPNEKQCDKAELTTTEKTIDYFVAFQNLGTDNARNIHIVDTIDQGIPIEYIQIQKNSHYEQFATSYKVRGHAIIWSFNNIELPAQSSVGDKGSSGFVAYQCGMTDRLELGQVFTNRAYIYFDFQKPIITNTTTSVVVKKGSAISEQREEFVVYPNPCFGAANVQSKHLGIQKLELYTSHGEIVYTQQIIGTDLSASFNITNLPVGVYLLRIYHALGAKVVTVLVQ